MQNLRITLVQINQVWQNKEANFKKYEEQLLTVETDLIVLPEMFQTGFSMNVKDLGENWNDSPSVNWLIKTSKEKNAAVYTSLIINDKGKYFNRGVFVYPTGRVEYYDKRKSFGLAGEDQFFTAGKNEKIVEYNGWKIQLQICYDLRFPEIIRNNLDENGQPAYDIILYVANWPEKRILHWDTLLMARAIENQCYVVGVNRIGEDENKYHYNGHSSIIDALGEKKQFEDHIQKAETSIISKENLLQTRKTLPFLRDR